MLCAFKMFRRQAAHHARSRRQRRCIPSLTEWASCLEDRVLLSAAGGKAHTAEIAPNPADTKVGREVTNLFESILQTNPTSAQLTRSVRELRSGMSVVALRKDLTAEARRNRRAGPALHERRRHQRRSVRPCDDFDEVGRDRSDHPGLDDAGPTGPDRYGRPAFHQALSDTRRDERLALVFAGVQCDSMSFSFGSPAASSTSGTMSPTSTMTGMSSTSMTKRHELDDHDRHELDDRHVDVLDRLDELDPGRFRRHGNIHHDDGHRHVGRRVADRGRRDGALS